MKTGDGWRPTSGFVALTALTALAIAVLGWREIFSWDIGFHLSEGRWMAEHRQILKHDVLTFTLYGTPTYYTHWLYQIGAWAAFSLGGTFALSAGHLSIVLAAMGLSLRRAIARNGGPTLTPCFLLLLFALGHTWELRSQLISWLGVSFTLGLLERYGRRPGRYIFVLPIVMALWVNLHSMFAVGLAVIAVYAGRELMKGRAADRRLIVAALLCLPAGLLNPHGVAGWRYPLRQFFMIQDARAFTSSTGIYEYLSPLAPLWTDAPLWTGLWHPHTFVWLMLMAGIAAAFFLRRRDGAAEVIVYLVLLYLFATARRNHGLFVLGAFPLLSAGLQRAVQSGARFLSPRRQKTGAAVGSTALAAVCILLIVGAVNGYYYRLQGSHDRFGHRFNAHYLPVGAADFLNRPDLPDAPLLNALHDGGYLGFATRRKVYVDGRLEIGGPAFYRHCMSLVHPEALGRAVLKHNLQLAVAPYADVPAWMMLFGPHPDWRCVFLDAYAAVFFRRDYAPHVPALTKAQMTETKKESSHGGTGDTEKNKNLIQN